MFVATNNIRKQNKITTATGHGDHDIRLEFIYDFVLDYVSVTSI